MKRNILLALLSGLVGISANAAIIATLEAPGVQTTTMVSPTLVETFNGKTVATINPSVIGVYTTGTTFKIGAADVFGGAAGTDYAYVGKGTTSLSYTLSFGKDLTYFGLYWSAIDPGNELQFYKSGGLVASFKITDLGVGVDKFQDPYPGGCCVAASLKGYYSNPTDPGKGGNTEEPYAFVNFSATGGTVFDEVKFVNATTTDTAFESDNHTIAGGVPEPTSLAMMGLAVAALALKLRK